VEGHVVLRHRQSVEVLQAFRELVSVAFGRKKTHCLLVVNAICGRKIQFGLQWLFQGLLEAKTVGVDAVPVFLREYKGESDEAFQFTRETDAFGKAKHG
jgi:hypothetical protein